MNIWSLFDLCFVEFGCVSALEKLQNLECDLIGFFETPSMIQRGSNLKATMV